MNSPVIEMDRAEAVRKLEQYEEAARKSPSRWPEVDRALLAGYRAVAKDKRVLDVNQAIRHGGLNLAGQPKLAIARAHVERTRFYFNGSEAVFWWHDKARWNGNYSGDNYRWPVPLGVFDTARLSRREGLTAMVPYIPPQHRPRHNLANYFMLWEANWHIEPPDDPYLLRPIVGPLMEIVAEWELTPLEIVAVTAAMRPS